MPYAFMPFFRESRFDRSTGSRPTASEFQATVQRLLTAESYKIMKTEPKGEIVLCWTRDGKTTLEARLQKDTAIVAKFATVQE